MDFYSLLESWETDFPDEVCHIEFEFVPVDGKQLLLITVDVGGELTFLSSQIGSA